MSEYQYDCATSKREARKAIYSCFDEDKKLNNSSYFNKIILISESDANINLANELYTFFGEKNYRLVQLEEDDDFSKHLLSKPIKDVSSGMCVYIMDELPDCVIRNAFVLELTY
tara:strand:- start:2358 stop:2699 length:342 start_codon:yes stop_codon:yes gene_type:complete